jgi:hypothetical protein
MEQTYQLMNQTYRSVHRACDGFLPGVGARVSGEEGRRNLRTREESGCFWKKLLKDTPAPRTPIMPLQMWLPGSGQEVGSNLDIQGWNAVPTRCISIQGMTEAVLVSYERNSGDAERR